MGSAVEYRDLKSPQDFDACLQLQRHTWGDDFEELVPATVIKISQKVGGLALGAFDSDQRLLGFVWGLTGLRERALVHWSHMLAVVPEARGRGVGKGLKFLQRERLLEMGVEQMLWTYDPLVARNATLNLVRLGAYPIEYVVNMYGESTGSSLHSGLGTDRFVVRWDLSRGVASTNAGRSSQGLVDQIEGLETTPVLNRHSAGDAAPDSASAVREPSQRRLGDWLEQSRHGLVEVPADIEQLKRLRPQEATAYRDSLRGLFPQLLEAGCRIEGVVWPDASRAWYVVAPPNEMTKRS